MISIMLVTLACFLAPILWMQVRIGHKAGFTWAGRFLFLWMLLTVIDALGAFDIAFDHGLGLGFISVMISLPWLILAWIFAYSRWPALDPTMKWTTGRSGALVGSGAPGELGPFRAREAPPSPPPLAQTRPVEPPALSTPAAQPRPALAAELEKLSTLHASGALTDEEYAQAKKKLLS